MDTFASTPFDWFNYVAQNYNSNALIQFVLKVENKIDFDILQRATYLCTIADPIIGCCFFTNAQLPVWTKTYQDYFHMCSKIQCENTKIEIDCCLAEKINAEKDLPVKVFMVESTNDTFLVIKIHHALCDAAGAIDFVKLLSKMYSELENNANFIPERITPIRDTKNFYKHFGVTDKSQRFNPALLQKMESTWGVPAKNILSTQTFTYKIKRFSKCEIDNIISFAKKNNSSLNAVITAAYYSALLDIIKPSEESKEIQFSVNLRKFMGTEGRNTICNLSNLYNIQLPVKCSFEKLATLTKQAIDKIVEPENILQSVLACELMSSSFKTLDSFYAADWENVKKSGFCTPMISNIGRLDNNLIVFGKCKIVDMFLVSPAFISPSFMLSVSTFNNVMTLCVAYQKPSLDDNFVESLLNKVENLLNYAA